MIPVLAAGVVLVGVVAVADLLLSFAIIRRLAAQPAPGAKATGTPVPGQPIGEFRAGLLGGGEFTLESLRHAPAMVVFLSPACEPCRRAISELKEFPVPLSRALYVLIAGSAQDPDVLAVAADMPAGARIGAIAHDDDIMTAFAVDGYPTVVNVADGIVLGSGFRVGDMLEPARG